MNKYLKNLNRLEFVVTLACTGKCRHCSQGEHKSSENIDKKIASDAVRSVACNYNIKSVMTFGGEPLLYPDTVCEIHRAAKEMKIAQRQLITNGYFSKDYDVIERVADDIIRSGVNEILLSVDAFHQETIPLEYVIAFAKAVNVPGVKLQVHPAWLVSAQDDNEYNNTTRLLLKEFNDMGISASEGNIVFPAGNAIEYLGKYFDHDNTYTNPYLEDPTDIKAICIAASGDVLGGNIRLRNIDEILSSYLPK